MRFDWTTLMSQLATATCFVRTSVSGNCFLHLIVPGLIGIASVLVAVQVNHGVRIRRIKLIHGFARTFSPQSRKRSPCRAPDNNQPGSRPNTDGDKSPKTSQKEHDIRYSPSLEFVVTKYITDLDEKLTHSEFRVLRDLELFADMDPDLGGILKKVRWFSLATNRRMLVYSLPFMVVVGCGFSIVSLALHSLSPFFAIHRQPVTIACVSDLVPISIAFFSGYLATLNMVVRAVALFDLTATTFMRAGLHIIGAVFTGFLVWTVIEAFLGADACGVTLRWLTYPMLFAVGFVPDAGTRFLLTSLGSLLQPNASDPQTKTLAGYVAVLFQFMKLTDGRFANTTKSIPLDVIDGIDFFTRYRLEEAGIYEVQNLAVANPILLHVETPFGIYQTIDWVGQAQLCTVVGPQRFLILRQFNIRTVFDLERAVLSLKATSEIRRIIGGILLMTTDTMSKIEKDCGLSFPNMANPRDGSLKADDYTKWAVEQALKPSTYRVKIPVTPVPFQPSAVYRVYPVILPDGAEDVGEFAVVGEAIHDDDGVQQPNLQSYKVYEFKNAEDATIKHIVRLIMDDLHVMRLRQIWESIGRILGGDAATLDDSEDTFLGA